MFSRRNALAVFAAGLGGMVAGVLVAPGSGRAQQAVPGAGEFISRLAQRAIQTLTPTGIESGERERRFRTLLNENFDVQLIGRFALGRFWRQANEAERAEYIKLFEELLVQTYANRFTEYAGENLRILRSALGSDGAVTVGTELARTAGQPPTKIDWRLRREGSSFKIFDVGVEGVSMSITMRDDFSAGIQKGGGKVEALLQQLREKTSPAPVQPAGDLDDPGSTDSRA